jgi:2'-5' RNA ligase
METQRVFFAVDLDASTRQAAAEISRGCEYAQGGDRVRWLRQDTFHVTMRFLGDTDPEQISGLAECVRKQTAGVKPFRMELGGVRPFPNRRSAFAVVLDVGPVERFEELAAAVERGVVAAGFTPESRPFRPHLTLGRIRGKRFSGVTAAVTPTGQGYEVSEVVLFRSDLHPSGAQYTPLERALLGNENDTPQNRDGSEI